MVLKRTTMRVRAGFTLVELLVVMVIIVFLAALLIAFMPALSSQAAEANAAVSLQGWLNIARQKAIRNQNPYGLRLWVKNLTLFTPTLPAPTLFVAECQYIEQPDDFTGGTITTQSSQNNGVWDTVAMSGVDPTGGFNDPALYPVQVGDYVEVLGTGLMHRIVQINTTVVGVAGNPIAPPSLSLASPTPYQIASGTGNYRILRGPRVIGSETLPLPDGVFIDLQTNATYGNSLPTFQYTYPPPPPVGQPPNGAFVDVLFSPSGSLLGVSQGYLAFWVRQPDTTTAPGSTPADVFAGSPTIIAVFAQTGFVGAYPPVKSATPYSDIR